KSYATLEYSKMEMMYADINEPNPVRFKLDNLNFYWNNSYVHNFSRNLEGFIGFSIANSNTSVNQSFDEFKKDEFGLNVKSEFEWKPSSKQNFRIGSEFVRRINENRDVMQNVSSEINENLF